MKSPSSPIPSAHLQTIEVTVPVLTSTNPSSASRLMATDERDTAAEQPIPTNEMEVTQEKKQKQEENAEGGIEYFSKRKRWSLLMVFCLAGFLDVSCRSGVLLFTEQIAQDLNIAYETSTWILNSFDVPFACFLLFWGRVSDLFSPRLVFVGGFTCLGISCLCGMFCSATIPSAFRLIMVMFNGKEREKAITVFSLSAAIANSAGFILAGFFQLITHTGQMSGWRWYLRFVALLSVPFSILAYFYCPNTASSSAEHKYTTWEKWRRFDLIGCILMLLATLLFILSLTLGATNGWKTASFLVPFLLCWPVGAFFGLVWEARLKDGYAHIPSKTWKIRNLALLLFISVGVLAYWPSTQLPLSERWHAYNGEEPIMIAVRLLPQGLSSIIPIFILPYVPEKWKSSRWSIVIIYIIIATMLLPLIYSHGVLYHGAYWKYYFPSFVVASFFGAVVYSCISIAVMSSVPDEMTGVAGALLQVVFQVGGAAAFSIQAGLMTLYPGTFYNFHNIQASWWFFAGWYAVSALLVAVLFRDPRKSETKLGRDANTRECSQSEDDEEEANAEASGVKKIEANAEKESH